MCFGSDRALPIYGDHVGAFAAFFGKPLPDNTSTMFEGEDVGIMVGLTDVNGLLYMIASSLD